MASFRPGKAIQPELAPFSFVVGRTFFRLDSCVRRQAVLATTLVDGALRASSFCFIRSLNGSYRRR
jgi:hypothetical protein